MKAEKMKNIKKGDKLVCKKTLKNVFGQILFEKDKIYDVLCVDNESDIVLITLNHNLYANEYMSNALQTIQKYFKLT